MEVDDERVFPGFLTPLLKQISLQRHRLLFPHASAEVRGKNTPEKKFASTGSRTHNHQVMSPIRYPLSHSDGSEVGGRANDGVGHGSIDNVCANEN